MKDILTVQEVADYLRVSRVTVWRWCKEGKLAAFKAGRGWRVRRAEIEELVREQGYNDNQDELVIPAMPSRV